MVCSLESLEEKFRRVEQANEHRVLDDPEGSQMVLVDPLTEPRSYHKKMGLSVSQSGKQEERDDGLHSLGSSPPFGAPSKSTIYRALANSRSVDSFVSVNFEEETRHAEEQHETQVEIIAGRKTFPNTVGALLPRRLARTDSQPGYIAVSRCTVVDVLVETTTESLHRSPNLQRSIAYAARPSRLRAATISSPTPHAGLVERAKEFARKLRRKSRVEHR